MNTSFPANQPAQSIQFETTARHEVVVHRCNHVIGKSLQHCERFFVVRIVQTNAVGTAYIKNLSYRPSGDLN
ncbi:hypothetical protein CR51_05755 [Caballeronia megalochromosomata]|nr:hypothetical protein CR51_05755 [Caballeronia megalochromosomata]